MTAAASVASLILRCRSGDAKAREELFQRYRSYLGILAQAQLGRQLQAKCDASDLVQQTLLEAYRDFATFKGHQEPELLAWLRQILAHNLYNEARRYAARQRDTSREVSLDEMHRGVEHSSLALGRCLQAATDSPSTIASQREDATRLATAMADLIPDYQTVLLLRIFEGLSAEEVAQRMNRSAGAVRMLQMRALAALREKITQMDDPPTKS